jgi:hypothetical protein
MNRLGLESRRACRRARQSHRAGQVKINELATLRTNSMIVSISFAIITAGAVAELNLMNQSFVSQKPERVINRGETNPRQLPPRGVEDLGSGGMMIARLNRFEHHLTLAGQYHRRRFGLLPGHVLNYNNSKSRVKRAVSEGPTVRKGNASEEVAAGLALPQSTLPLLIHTWL